MSEVLEHAVTAYRRNFKLVSFFSLPLLVAFSLALFLPNYVALSSAFLRFKSVASSLSPVDAVVTIAAFLVSLFLFSFGVAAINTIVRSQRTLTRLAHDEAERVENSTYKIFLVFLTVFAVAFAVNMLLYYFPSPVARPLAALLTLAVYGAVLFAPQAIVLEDLGARQAVARSISTIRRRFDGFVFVLAFAALLLIAGTQLFLWLEPALGGWARILSLALNALVILPFFEVLKTQVYLTKYSLL